jgi:hypothetical protein
VTADTLLPLGSIHKVMTAFLVARLVDGGQVVRIESEDADNDPLSLSGSLKPLAKDMALCLHVLLAGGTNQDGHLHDRQVVSAESTPGSLSYWSTRASGRAGHSCPIGRQRFGSP